VVAKKPRCLRFRTIAEALPRRYDFIMFTAYVRFADGRVEAVPSVDGLGEIASRDGTALWVDLEKAEEDELKTVGAALKLDAESLEDCRYGEQRPRIDEFADHVFLVFYGLLGVDGGREAAPRKLAVFYSPRFLVTVHEQSLKTIHALRHRFERVTSQPLGRGTDYLLYGMIDAMVDNYMLVVDGYETQLEQIEDESLEEDVDDRVLAESGMLRRRLLDVRRLSVSSRELIAPIVQGELDYVSESLETRFRHVSDHLSHVIEMTEILRERLDGVRDNYHTAIANRTNRIMKTLTVIATILLPLTFIAGVYGMNLPLWPPPDHPASFWGVIGVMLAIAFAMLVYFRRKNWL